MRSIQSLRSIAIVMFMVGILAGCAAYRHCGLEGCPSDEKITANVQAQLNQHPDLGPPNTISVQTSSQVVYLNGTVGDGLEKTTAAAVAQQVSGVKQVVNNIAIIR